MAKHWKLKPHVPEEFCKKFPEFSTLGAQLLYNRNLEDEESIKEFVNPKFENLNDPFLFGDMAKAVERIWEALEKGEPVCIYGDYDADAVTANAVLQQTFRYLGVEVGSYIPDRFTEGYGLNLEAFEKLKNSGYKLVITVDCGTNSTDIAEFCSSNGMDLIITDHHEIIGEVPRAYALINPKNRADKYPYEDVTGVGVAFKLASALLEKSDRVKKWISRQNESGLMKRPLKYVPGWEKWLLDLVAIGTVADCHSLLGENRILVKFGLQVLPKSKWRGLRALSRTAKLDFVHRPPDTYTLGFVVAPRLNAAGRLKHADIALHLLMEEDPVKASDKATELENINKERQQHTEWILSQAREKAELIMDRKVLVLMGEDWPKGVVGLVAGKLVEEYNKPVMVLSKSGDEATGSARTVGEFDVVAGLKYAAEHLVKFGGHKQAAGLTLKAEHYEIFYQKLLEYAQDHLTDEDLKKHLTLEAELAEQDLQLEVYRLISKFEPFGVGNPKPKFLVPGCKVVGLREVGAQSQHLQIQLLKGSRQISGIAFSMGYFAKTLKVGDTIDVAAELIEDGWNGRNDVKLRVVDIKTN